MVNLLCRILVMWLVAGTEKTKFPSCLLIRQSLSHTLSQTVVLFLGSLGDAHEQFTGMHVFINRHVLVRRLVQLLNGGPEGSWR